MNSIKTTWIYLILSLLHLTTINTSRVLSQSTFDASGGDLLSSDGSISFSMGQVLHRTIRSDANQNITFGVQQPIESLMISGLDKDILNESKVSVFPNPAKGYIHINTDHNSPVILWFELYDMMGRIQMKNELSLGSTIIDLNDLEPTIYLLKLRCNEKTVESLKIIITK